MSRTTWVSVTLKVDSGLAWLVEHGAGDDQWIPKSQIEDYSEPEVKSGMTLEIEIPEWLAMEKGMI